VKRLWIWLVLAALPVSAGLFRVWVHQDLVRLGYQLSEQEAQSRKLRHRVQQLEVQLAAERSPARLLELASQHGFVPPRPDQFVGKARKDGE